MKKASCIIGDKKIQEGGRVFIIAEAGVNHNTQLNVAYKLIDLAAISGADAVKFSTFKAEQVVTKEGRMADYQKHNLKMEESQANMLKKLELPVEYWPKIAAYCMKKKITFFSTPHGGRASVDLLEELHVPAYKVGSGDLTNYILLERLAQTQKPIILSTGMATLEEVEQAIAFLKNKKCKKIVILHCTTNYPCRLDEINMMAMKTMMRKFHVPIGYSDHSRGNSAAIVATIMKASVYEFHITLDHNLPGPDHIASADPQEAFERIMCIRMIEQQRITTPKKISRVQKMIEKNPIGKMILGSAIKKPSPSELQYIPLVRRHLVVTKNLEKNHILEASDIEAKRPANIGISPIHYETLIRKKLRHKMNTDDPLTLEDVQ